MRKITVISMITMDGVLQAPGGPGEDTSNGFKYGGWSAPYGDEMGNAIMAKLMNPSDYLLGRKTFDIFESYWPKHADIWPAVNNGTKYVLSAHRQNSDWKNTTFLKDLADIKKMKNAQGPDIQVWGSSELIQLLFKNDLVDELLIITYPLTLGDGKKLFSEGTSPAAFKLTEGIVTPSGLIIANYERAGEVKTGTVEM